MKLPDFLIIGGMRCGTTSLHEMMRGHPNLCFPSKKEVHFFDKRNSQLGVSVQEYGTLFTPCSVDKLCGEATPDYLSTEGCDRFICEVIPSVKLIIILRNPVDRAWSHYLFSEYKKVETLEFRAALNTEEERLKIKSDHSDIFFSYLQRSLYIEHILRFETLFGRAQIKILFLEELIQNTRRVLADVFYFLGLMDTPSLAKAPHLNRTLKSRGVLKMAFPMFASSAVISSPDRQYLKSYFKEHDERLASWLGRKLPWT